MSIPTPSRDLLVGGGEMGALIRAMNWERTPFGPIESWPQSLRTAVNIMLESRFPMVVAWGPDFRFFYNDRYRPILGVKHPALGVACRDIFPEVWPVVGPEFERVRRGEAFDVEDWYLPLERHGYAENCWFTLSYSPIRDESGAVAGLLAVVAETTRRVESERRLTTLRDLAKAAASATSDRDACRNAAVIFERNPVDVPFALFYLTNDDGATATLVDCAGISANHPAAAPEIDLSRTIAEWPLPAGDYPEGATSAIAMPLARPGTDRSYGILVAGVSARRRLDDAYRSFFALTADHVATAIANARAHAEARQRADALAELDRAKTAFFSNISHEFRTPLTLMLGPTEDALATGALTQPDLQTVYRNQQRLLKLVNTLLDFSRIEAGRADASYEPTDLAEATADVASAFRSAVERGGIRFDVACDPIGEPVYVDRSMWEKIVLNLLSNAFKFTFAGTIRVGVTRRGDRAVLTVTDSGIGIPAHELSRVFDRFHRIEGARGRTIEGSGIGLALVKDLVTLHGGDIAVESRVGEGTTFTVSIPVGVAHLPAQHIKATVSSTRVSASDVFVGEALRWLPEPPADDVSRPAESTPTGSIVPGRVLVVDDNADMRDYLYRLLSPCWHVEVAGDGATAIDMIRDQPPDLVLADVMMPALDGFGLLRELRRDQRTATIPIVMLSARAGEEARLEGIESGANDYIVKPFSGRELISRINAQLIMTAHARERMELLAREQTARREAQLQKDHLQLLFMQFPSPIVIFRGPDLVIELANDATCAVWGRTAAQVVGRPFEDALPEMRGQAFPTLLRQVMESGQPFIGREVEARLARGADGALESVYFNFVYAPMRDATGRVEGVLVIALDVTEQVVALRHVDALRADAEAANRAKDEFLAVLGHELRNPLAPILTALQLIQLRGDAGLERERRIIERQAQHLVRLVDDLLDVSRIARGVIELRKERIELAELVAKTIEMAGPLLEKRRHHVTVDVPQTGLAIEADPARFGQVLMNLLGNAVKFTETGGRITVHGWREGDEVCVRVADNGIGIDPAMLSAVFDMFAQDQQTIARSQGGLGLGLTIVRSLVALHGGSVTATSQGRGLGAEFTVRVPASTTPAAPAAAAPSMVATAPPQSRRVLIVDDNEDLVATLADVLRSAGHVVATALDGPSALRIAPAFAPDIALVDIGLPVMDGYELARRLRGDAALGTVKLIAVTGYGQDLDRQRSLEAGFDLHLVKPLDIALLSELLANPVA